MEKALFEQLIASCTGNLQKLNAPLGIEPDLNEIKNLMQWIKHQLQK